MVRDKRDKPAFVPPSVIPQVLAVTLDTLDASQDQLKNFKRAKESPSSLDDYTVDRSIRLYTQQKEDAVFFLEQVGIWKQQRLSTPQLEQVQTIEISTHQILNIADELLDILDYCKDFTIEKILAKDPLELALGTLTGKIPLT